MAKMQRGSMQVNHSRRSAQEDLHLTVGGIIVLTPQEVAKLVRRTEPRATRPRLRGPLAQPR
jgi:hypothetical protein